MQVYLTVILSLSMLRFIMKETNQKTHPASRVIATLICIASDIVGIVFVWHL